METPSFPAVEKAAPAIESGAVSEILALALKLQSQGDDLLGEAQIVEMGRELGIQPEYVREALRLWRGSMPSSPYRPPGPATRARWWDDHHVADVGRAFLMLFSLGLLPAALGALSRGQNDLSAEVFFLSLASAAVVGWAAQRSRLASIAGALVVPFVLFISAVYPRVGFGGDTLLLCLLSLCPLCAAVGSASGRARGWLARLVERLGSAVPGH